MQARKIKAKTILSRVKNDTWFGFSYNMNLYRGCQHACIYCDSRSTCYQLGELSDIRYKDNAIELLTKELQGKKHKGTIGFGSMNDPYMPIEKELKLTRHALEVVSYYKYPIHVITKSNLVVRDIDLLKQISKIYAAISFTITTADDNLAKIIEPNAPLPSERFAAIKELRKNNIYCGITLMPFLPYINDTIEQVEDLIETAIFNGAKYFIPAFGLTLREGSRDYFYKKLDVYFKGIKEEYERKFGDSYNCVSPNAKKLQAMYKQLLRKHGVEGRMQFYAPKQPQQMKLF